MLLQQGDIFAEQYQLKKLVDTGGFAEVWEAIFLKVKSGNIVALKIFPRLNDAGIKNIENEYLTQVDLMHSNLITARHFGIHEGRPYLVMRFCSGGNAIDKAGEFDELSVAKCFNQVASALTYLHHKDILHKDIKPNNILIDDEGNFYLTDMGLSMKLRQTIQRYTQVKNNTDFPGSTNPINTTGLTPPPYRALELWEYNSVASKPTDIWALGASVFEIATGELPFMDFGGSMQKNNPEPPDLPQNFSSDLNKIVKKCLSKNKEDRPTAEEIAEWTGNYLKSGTYKIPGENVVEPIAPINVPPAVVSPITQVQPPAQFGGTIKYKEPETITPTAPIVPTPQKEKESGSKKIIIGIVVLLVAAAIVFFVMHKQGSSKKTEPVVTDTIKKKVVDSTVLQTPDPNTKDSTIKPPPPVKDRDHDGVADDVDRCPDQFGLASNQGCPVVKDRDHDGVPDDVDRCPTEAGPASNHGCPVIKDRDHDGVPDDKDDCPDLPGSPRKHGCPLRAGS